VRRLRAYDVAGPRGGRGRRRAARHRRGGAPLGPCGGDHRAPHGHPLRHRRAAAGGRRGGGAQVDERPGDLRETGGPRLSGRAEPHRAGPGHALRHGRALAPRCPALLAAVALRDRCGRRRARAGGPPRRDALAPLPDVGPPCGLGAPGGVRAGRRRREPHGGDRVPAAARRPGRRPAADRPDAGLPRTGPLARGRRDARHALPGALLARAPVRGARRGAGTGRLAAGARAGAAPGGPGLPRLRACPLAPGLG
jgi:hypothetical protein